MKKLCPLLLGCCVAFSVNSVETDPVTRANELYEAGNRDQAKSLYTLAAEQGKAEAHFRLAYQYILPDEQRAFHYQQAALQGHQEALEYYLEAVFFRAGSIKMSDPKSALAAYQAAKQQNPNLSLYDEDRSVQILTYAAEVPERDIDAFFDTYQVEDEDGKWPFYDVWELAEQASKEGGIFGKPDPELTLWLITRGGHVPAELSYAVKDYYQHWKNNQVVPFDICQYVTSGDGAGFCARRVADEQEIRRQSDLAALKEQLLGENRALVDVAYKEMEAFVTLKAYQEEMHGGTGRLAWISESIQEQKNRYIEMLEKALQGNIERVATPLAETDNRLNTTYKVVMSKIKQLSSGDEMPKPQELREVQRQWIKFRDATCSLLASIDQQFQEQCLNSLTAQREQQLEDIMHIPEI
ncbi:hypothetical protein GV64_12485 [Endozoicomonas elysicola]|uniref:Lysozyme inhibitor LprI-like N-terminal domain-containing protein n=1 Tax=Endozoicomonas elysicola TaxID=305900 RepID=A0A081KBC4_9GAMM|nr:hypothetical protein GV64_12485 [Endozoicomonas elysicola]